MSLLLRIWQVVSRVLTGTTQIESRLQAIEEKLELILAILQPEPAVKIIFVADLEGTITEGMERMNLGADQKVGLSIKPVDKRGNPATVDGVPEWASSNSELVSVVAAADGMSAVATAVGPLGGPATVSVKVDADLGTGIKELIGTLEITVTGGQAAVIEITAGTPEAQE